MSRPGATVSVANQTIVFGLDRNLEQIIRDRLTFTNPEFIDREKRGLWLGNTQQQLCYFEECRDGYVVPRGFTRQLLMIIKNQDVKYQVDDQRRTLPPVDFAFTGQLRDYQQEALEAILTRDFGTLSAPTGSGKTVIGLAAIAARRQPALVIVHSKELLNQWIERIESFLGIPAGQVGRISGGKIRIGDRVTVGLVQSLYKCPEEVAPHVGFLVVDECHRAPSRTFTEAITAFDCKYQLGLSATPWRRDGLNRLIYWYVGDVVHKIDQAGLVESGDILQAEVIRRETSFQTSLDPSTQYSKMLSQLCEDPDRNRLIISDVAEEAKSSAGVIIVLSDRKSHCESLRILLKAHHGINAAILTGDLSTKDRERVVHDLHNGACKVVIATGQLVGEGFDCRELSTLFLATPIKFSGRVLQYLGRVLRPAPGKQQARVLDYLDPVRVLQAAARSRAKVYGRAA